MFSKRSPQTVRLVVLLAVLALITAACGSRRPHDEVVAAATGLRTADGGEIAADSGAAEPGTATTAAAQSGSATTTAGGSGGGGGGGATGGGAGGGGAEGQGGAKSPVVIGNIGTYSGPAGPSLSGLARGAQVWARSVNERGGLNGHPVELVVADDGGDSAKHLSLVKEFVEQRGAIAFMANGEAVSGAGSVDYLNQKGVPLVGSEGAGQYFYESPVHFPQHATGDALIDAAALGIASVAKPEGKTKMGIIACIEVQICQDAIRKSPAKAKEYGMEVVYTASASFAQASYTSNCLQARSAGVEVLSMAMDPGSVSRIAADCVSQGFEPTFSYASSIAVDAHRTDENLQGSLVIIPIGFWFDDVGARAEFQQAMAKFAPDTEPTPSHLQAWVSGKILELGAKQLGEPATPKALLDGLYSIHGDVLPELTGPLLFNRGAPATPTSCVWVVRVERKEWTKAKDRACPLMRVREVRVRRGLAAAYGLTVLGAAIALPAASSGAQTADLTSFTVTASADTIRVNVGAANAPLGANADLGAPVAQVELSGLGTSKGFASAPYPGDFAFGVVPIVFGQAGINQEAPTYPLLASSSHPTSPDAEVSQPGLRLLARSDERSSNASADVGGGVADDSSVGRSAADASGVVEAGEAVAQSSSSAESVAFAGVLRIGSATASAKVVRATDGTLEATSSFEADGVSVAGLEIGVSDKGLVLPGSTAPVPESSGNPVLDAAGITVRYLEPIVTESSVVSAGLTVEMAQNLPSFGKGVVTYTFGRATASAAATADEALGELPELGGVTPAPGTAELTPTTGSGAIEAPSLPPATASAPASPSPEPPAAAPAQPIGALSLPSAVTFYLVLVIGAAVAAVGLGAVRIFGVKLAWT